MNTKTTIGILMLVAAGIIFDNAYGSEIDESNTNDTKFIDNIKIKIQNIDNKSVDIDINFFQHTTSFSVNPVITYSNQSHTTKIGKGQISLPNSIMGIPTDSLADKISTNILNYGMYKFSEALISAVTLNRLSILLKGLLITFFATGIISSHNRLFQRFTHKKVQQAHSRVGEELLGWQYACNKTPFATTVFL